MSDPQAEITRLLQGIEQGEPGRAGELLPLVDGGEEAIAFYERAFGASCVFKSPMPGGDKLAGGYFSVGVLPGAPPVLPGADCPLPSISSCSLIFWAA